MDFIASVKEILLVIKMIIAPESIMNQISSLKFPIFLTVMRRNTIKRTITGIII